MRFTTLWNEPEFLSESAPPEFFDTPITIAVIADTHFGDRPRPLPTQLIDTIKHADVILHAGDFSSVAAFDMISALGELRGVRGNNDDPSFGRRLPMRRSFQFGRFSAIMMHGHGFGRLTAEKAVEQELAGRCDVVIFGHSHLPFQMECKGTLLFNPGSPTQRRRAPHHTYGLIRIDSSIEATIQIINQS